MINGFEKKIDVKKLEKKRIHKVMCYATRQ